MNPTTQTLSPLRQRMIDDMRMRKLSPKTQNGYLRTVSRFYGWLGRSPDIATAEDLRRYQLYLVEHGMSAISLNVTITGLTFFFKSTLDRPELMRHMHPAREPRKNPVVLSQEEVARLIGCYRCDSLRTHVDRLLASDDLLDRRAMGQVGYRYWRSKGRWRTE